MKSARLTPVGGLLLGLLVLGLVALFVGSHTLQAIGFIVVVLVVLLLVAEHLPRMTVMNVGLPALSTRLRRRRGVDDDADADAERDPQATAPSEDAWAHEEALYRVNNRTGRGS